MDFSSVQIAETSGLVAGALVAIAFGMQKMLKNWKETSTESSILDMMHTELGRMSQQNIVLSSELNKLQVELITLNKELIKLTTENQRLHSEVGALTAEINKLKAFLPIRKQHNGTN